MLNFKNFLNEVAAPTAPPASPPASPPSSNPTVGLSQAVRKPSSTVHTVKLSDAINQFITKHNNQQQQQQQQQDALSLKSSKFGNGQEIKVTTKNNNTINLIKISINGPSKKDPTKTVNKTYFQLNGSSDPAIQSFLKKPIPTLADASGVVPPPDNTIKKIYVKPSKSNISGLTKLTFYDERFKVLTPTKDIDIKEVTTAVA